MKKKTYRKKLSTYQEVEEYVQNNAATIKRLYLGDDLTGRTVANRLNVEYSALFQKALFKHIGPKGKGHGGPRQGSGNKKGAIKFCGTCRKQIAPKDKCIC